jgi:hypothetical protein
MNGEDDERKDLDDSRKQVESQQHVIETTPLTEEWVHMEDVTSELDSNTEVE